MKPLSERQQLLVDFAEKSPTKSINTKEAMEVLQRPQQDARQALERLRYRGYFVVMSGGHRGNKPNNYKLVDPEAR